MRGLKDAHRPDAFKVSAFLLKIDGLPVQSPVENDIQGGVMNGLAAQNDAFSHRQLGPLGRQVYPGRF